jgi:hypothetical protein
MLKLLGIVFKTPIDWIHVLIITKDIHLFLHDTHIYIYIYKKFILISFMNNQEYKNLYNHIA